MPSRPLFSIVEAWLLRLFLGIAGVSFGLFVLLAAYEVLR